MSKFEFDRADSVESAVFQALGAASVCWEDISGTGIFDSTRAKEIGEALLEFIRNDQYCHCRECSQQLPEDRCPQGCDLCAYEES